MFKVYIQPVYVLVIKIMLQIILGLLVFQSSRTVCRFSMLFYQIVKSKGLPHKYSPGFTFLFAILNNKLEYGKNTIVFMLIDVFRA